MRIDAHQHFWEYDPVRDSWIDDNMQVIRRDFLPVDLQNELVANEMEGSVAVQADQSEKETDFLLSLAEEFDFIKGVVGWVDLRSDQLSDRLEFYSTNPFFSGVRHIAQAESDGFLVRKDVIHGISKLAQYELTYDILIYPHQNWQQLFIWCEVCPNRNSSLIILQNLRFQKVSMIIGKHIFGNLQSTRMSIANCREWLQKPGNTDGAEKNSILLWM